MQVQAALRIIIDKPLPPGELLRWDAWDLRLQKLKVKRRPDCPCCSKV